MCRETKHPPCYSGGGRFLSVESRERSSYFFSPKQTQPSPKHCKEKPIHVVLAEVVGAVEPITSEDFDLDMQHLAL